MKAAKSAIHWFRTDVVGYDVFSNIGGSVKGSTSWLGGRLCYR